MQLPKKLRDVDFPRPPSSPDKPTGPGDEPLPVPTPIEPSHHRTQEELEATVRRQAARDQEALLALMTKEEQRAYLRRRESLLGQR